MKIHIPAFRAMARCDEYMNHGPLDIDLGPDVVPVVRCRECKNLYVGGVCFGETLWACRKLKTSVDPEFFCGFGEQKEDEHDKHPSDPV